MRPFSRCVVSTIGAVVCAVGLKAQQTGPQQPPRFRSTIDVIQVDVAVVDRNKRPVSGLSAADFTLLENGKPQEIVGFAEVHVASASSSPASWTRTVPPDVRTNNLRDGRLFAIVMDDATMPPDVQITANARSIGRGIVTRLGPDDLAAVIFVSDSRRSVDFTNDRARLLAAIDGFMPGFAYVNPDPQSDSQHYFASIQTLGLVAARLTHVPQRRKAVIYVSTGVPVDLVKITRAGVIAPLRPEQSVPVVVSSMNEPTKEDLFDAAGALLADRPQEAYGAALQAALIRAQYGNVNVYSIDPAGLGGMEAYLQSRPRTTTTGFTQVSQLDALAESRLRREYLLAVADDSGGRAILNTNSFDAGLARVFEDNSIYYLVGYQSAHDPQDKTVRHVSVRMNREGLSGTTRNAYASPRDDRPAGPPARELGASLIAALGDVLPNPAISLRAVSAAFAIPGGRAGLTIAMGVSQPVVGDAGARINERLNLFAAAYAPDGTPKAWFRQSLHVGLRAGMAESADYEVLARLDLDPGRYQVRLAANSAMSGKTGSVYFDVVVPAFARESLQLSGLVISVGDRPSTVPGESSAPLIPVKPTSRRTFRAGETINGFLRVYQSESRAPGPVTVTGTITDDRNRVLQQSTLVLAPDKFSGGQADYEWRLPVSGLAPGEYLLTMAAAGGGQTVRREVRFSLR